MPRLKLCVYEEGQGQLLKRTWSMSLSIFMLRFSPSWAMPCDILLGEGKLAGFPYLLSYTKHLNIFQPVNIDSAC
ncbi:hypothetical protein BDV12DRAFT_171619 [Aspergillus spectabilis]